MSNIGKPPILPPIHPVRGVVGDSIDSCIICTILNHLSAHHPHYIVSIIIIDSESVAST